MSKEDTFPSTIPSLLATQLMAAEVYSRFLHVSSEGEQELWKKMLAEELDHIAYLRELLYETDPAEFTFELPEVNLSRMRDCCDHVILMGSSLFLLRLEGALRLECAELDYGLEGMVARRLKKQDTRFDYPGDISEHVGTLMHEAARYAESRNIGLQIRRLREILETSLSDTSVIPRLDNPRELL